MAPTPSSNWLALKKKLPTDGRPKKRRKTDAVLEVATSEVGSVMGASTRASSLAPSVASTTEVDKSPDSVSALRRMVYGESSYAESHKLPGKYIAIDCEMVGIAGDPSKRNSTSRDKGDESSLARVSVVNYYGYVLLDTFVRQRERVTDWRTAVSGVRESDMVNAKSFSEVQKLVADLIKDKVLVGHAVHNDLEALLLSHPHNLTRDTQVLAGRHGTLSANKAAENASDPSKPVKRNKRQALRNLVTSEIGIDIQSGEHSSIIDARATMAVYRLHKKLWDKGFAPSIHKIKKKKSKTQITDVSTKISSPEPSSNGKSSGKRKHATEDDDSPSNSQPSLKSKKQGISSGLSVVTKSRKGGVQSKKVVSGTRSQAKPATGSSSGSKWWATLGK
ncbi:hypothetical protein M422DRAFT_26152 [Sphaerobolus stellatus SS14]|nr:hypothetical protein M422DRAFT_26152 [Sphaerobolus stellatus SS14]